MAVPPSGSSAQTRKRRPSERRAEQQARRRETHRRTIRRSPWQRWAWVLLFAALVILVIFLIVRLVGASQPPGPIAGVVTFSNLSREHREGPIAYPQNPPVGGPHSPVWQNCGIYSSPVANEHAVHSLEHGAVWITYQPSLDATQVQQLQSLVRGHGHALLSPYPGLPAPVVASAWGVQLQVKSASDPRLAQFLAKYEQGPQTPEPGAPCSGGIGTPDEQ